VGVQYFSDAVMVESLFKANRSRTTRNRLKISSHLALSLHTCGSPRPAPATQLGRPSFFTANDTVSVTTACRVSSLFMTILVHLPLQRASCISRHPQKPTKPSFWLRHIILVTIQTLRRKVVHVDIKSPSSLIHYSCTSVVVSLSALLDLR